MATEFRNLLVKISKQITKNDVETIVAAARLPWEMREKSAETVLTKIGGNGDLSVANVDAVIDVMRQIGKSELYKEVKAFKKKSRKKLMDGSGQPAPPPTTGEIGSETIFDVAEREAFQVRNTLEKLESAEVVVSVDRIKELHSEATELADNLVRVIRRANVLLRATDPHSSPPSRTSSIEASDVGFAEASPPGGSTGGGFREQLMRRRPGSSKSVKISKTEKTPSPKSQRKINRSQTDVAIRGTKTLPHPNASVSLPSSSPAAAAGSDSEDDDYHEYTQPDWPPSSPVGAVVHTQPQQVPQRKYARTLARGPISAGGGNFGKETPNFTTPPRKNSKPGADAPPPPPPPQEPPPQESDSDLDYDDVIGVLDMYNAEKASGVMSPRSKPQSLHPEGLRPRNDQSPTCSTPSSEVASPPPTLPKPHSLKPRATTHPATHSNATPAIPIRRSSLKSGVQSATAPTGSTHSSSCSSIPQPSRSETTTPNQPMVDIQHAIRLKRMTGSPQSFGSSVGGCSDRVSPHPVSLAKALEMSHNQGLNSDSNDLCTEDSGFDEFMPPVAAAWNRPAPPPLAPKPKTLKQHSMEQHQQSYTNITIINPASTPSPPHHTAISHLAPIYGSTHTTPSPPSSTTTTTDHTTISAVGPMYNSITIEEQSQDSGPEEADDWSDYVNVKQYVEPT